MKFREEQLFLGTDKEARELLSFITWKIQDYETSYIIPEVLVLSDDYYYMLKAHIQEEPLIGHHCTVKEFMRAVYGIKTVIHNHKIKGVGIY